MDIKTAKQLMDETRETYEAAAEQFSETRSLVWDDLKPLVASVKAGDTVVDLGCGNGRLLKILQPLSISYIGIDSSKALLSLAKEQFPKARFLYGDMLQTGLTSQIADVVFCVAALQHIPSQELRLQATHEIARLLKPGGTVALLNWNLFSNYSRKKYRGDTDGDFMIPWKSGDGTVVGQRYYHAFVLEELIDLFAASGIRITRQYYIDHGKESSIGFAKNILTIGQLGGSIY